MPAFFPVALVLVCADLMGLTLFLALRYGYGLVYVGHTAAGWTTVHDAWLGGERLRVLEVDHTYQSATYLDKRWCDPVFPYHLLFDHLFDDWPDDAPHSVAVLGGGGYAVPKHLVAHHPELRRIDVIELDPAILRIARRHFLLDRLEQRFGAEATGRLCLLVGDAYDWLGDHPHRYDAIINDCFFGQEPERQLIGDEAARLIREHLTPCGAYLTNVVSALEGSEASLLHQVLTSLSRVFAHVCFYPCGSSDPYVPDNVIVIATDAPRIFDGALPSPYRELS